MFRMNPADNSGFFSLSVSISMPGNYYIYILYIKYYILYILKKKKKL